MVVSPTTELGVFQAEIVFDHCIRVLARERNHLEAVIEELQKQAHSYMEQPSVAPKYIQQLNSGLQPLSELSEDFAKMNMDTGDESPSPTNRLKSYGSRQSSPPDPIAQQSRLRFGDREATPPRSNSDLTVSRFYSGSSSGDKKQSRPQPPSDSIISRQYSNDCDPSRQNSNESSSRSPKGDTKQSRPQPITASRLNRQRTSESALTSLTSHTTNFSQSDANMMAYVKASSVLEHEMDRFRKNFKSNASNCKVGTVTEEGPVFWKRAHRLTTSSKFECFISLIIFTNSFLIGFELEWNARHRSETVHLAFTIAGAVYAIVFLAEILLRLLAEGLSFFSRSQNMLWNYFDLCIVILSTSESALSVILVLVGGSEDAAFGESQVRLARLLRVTRLMRFLRIARVARFVQPLRTLMVLIGSTLKQLFWSMVLLFLMIYVVAIIFAQAVADEMQTNVGLGPARTALMEHYWNDLIHSMLTLFKAITNGVDWEIPGGILYQIHPLLFWLYVFFIIFTVFAVLNIVVAEFVQSAIQSSQTDEGAMIERTRKQNVGYTNLVENLFRLLDKDGSGLLGLREMLQKFKDEDIQVYFESLDIMPEDAWSVWKAFNANDDETVDLEEFTKGCLRLRGAARGVDLAVLKQDNRHLIQEFYAHNALVKSYLQQVMQKVDHPVMQDSVAI